MFTQEHICFIFDHIKLMFVLFVDICISDICQCHGQLQSVLSQDTFNPTVRMADVVQGNHCNDQKNQFDHKHMVHSTCQDM